MPDCSVSDAGQRPVVDDRADDAAGVAARGRRRTGMSQTADATNTCGMSPVE